MARSYPVNGDWQRPALWFDGLMTHSDLSPVQVRVRALESALVAGGHVDPAALDALVETY